MMGLTGTALLAAQELVRVCPDAEIISGRRTVREQARAMAKNAFHDHDWIEDTYRSPLCLAARRLVSWLKMHKNATLDQIDDAFERILCALPDDELEQLTSHLGGCAFDVRADEAVKPFCEAVAKKYGGEFLDHEGRLIRYHLEFKAVS